MSQNYYLGVPYQQLPQRCISSVHFNTCFSNHKEHLDAAQIPGGAAVEPSGKYYSHPKIQSAQLAYSSPEVKMCAKQIPQ